MLAKFNFREISRPWMIQSVVAVAIGCLIALSGLLWLNYGEQMFIGRAFAFLAGCF